ncbi:zinc transport system ATP-binding protein [Methanomicrobium sp. W14]|uniref:metal ABC transporter ATP-binding protein n=1 Tax=Methanomicrobium sp. W14 TaxID=2817839 RepID=UPI001AE96740|nr:ABC transporter ATP-binding protein [Methanomicrobium sp. W14]MBP2133061.1 zinc transport system ATP-binding protein [Methanomicrobium sp. W14]
MEVPAIDLRNITVYREGQKVLDDISMKVDDGKFYAVIGPNGGGKTTLIKVILGLLKPDKGRVEIYGDPPEKNRFLLGYVPQFHTFDFSYPVTVGDMVLTGRLGHIGGIRKRFSENDRKLAAEAMEKLGISDLSKRGLGELSGGEQQRAIIARAIVGNPRVLILDEPTVYVDSPTEEKFNDILTELQRKMTVVLITHDIGVLSSGVDVVACLNRKLYTHNDNEITSDMILDAYKCPVDLIAHGLPHRVLEKHENLKVKSAKEDE